MFLYKGGFTLETICVIYIRISTDEDLQKWSLAGQHEELTRFAEKRGWKIFNEYKDEITGSASKRPGLDELRNDMAAGCFTVILVVDQDRISRMEPIDWEFFKKELRECGVKLVTPAQEIDFEDEDSELVSDVFNLFARHQRRKLKKAMRRGRAQAVKAGKWLGRVPYGYMKNKDGGLVPDPETASVVRYIFQEYAKGKGAPRLAHYDLDHIPSPNGTKWNKEVVVDMLRNPVYAGILSFRGVDGHTWKENNHEAIVDKKTFEACQQILYQRGAHNHFYMAQNRSHTLLNGVLVCECGKILTVKPIKKTVKGRRYEYYYYKHPRPTERPNKGIFAPQRDCTASYRTEKLDRAIVDTMKLIGSSPEAARKLIRLNNDQGEIRKLEAQLAALEQSEKVTQVKLGKLLKLYLRSDWDEKTLNIEKAALEKDLKKNHQEQRVLREKLALANRQNVTLEIIMEYFALLANFETEVSVADQRRIIQTIFPRIEVRKNGDMVATARIPLADIFQSTSKQQVSGYSRLHGNFSGLGVSYFTDHDNVGVLPKDGPQVIGKRNPRLFIYLRLVDALQSVFHRVFDRNNVLLDCVDFI